MKQIKKGIAFFRSAFSELRKVETLSGKQTAKFSLYVISVTIMGSVLIALLDLLFFNLLEAVLT